MIARPLSKLSTLKTRSEFLRLRGGSRFAGRSFVLECRLREPAPGSAAGRSLQNGPRFGFTVTKKLGNAVVRNRIRRRLKAAVQVALLRTELPDFDYVVIARQPAFDAPFEILSADFCKALSAIHAKPMQKHQRSDPKPRK
jgi:ribonuclease P protein component